MLRSACARWRGLQSAVQSSSKQYRIQLFRAMSDKAEETQTQRQEEQEQEQQQVSQEQAAEQETAPPLSEEQLEIQELQKRIEELEKLCGDMKDRQLRALAEMQNIQRIANKDVENAREFGIHKFAKQLLDVADNLDRALGSVSLTEKQDEQQDAMAMLRGLHEGVAATQRELMKVLGLNGISQFAKLGDAFDPNVHNALFEAPHPDHQDAPVTINVVKTGYMIKDRVLRAADVGVSRKA